jgi:hypothetical protein
VQPAALGQEGVDDIVRQDATDGPAVFDDEN